MPLGDSETDQSEAKLNVWNRGHLLSRSRLLNHLTAHVPLIYPVIVSDILWLVEYIVFREKAWFWTLISRNVVVLLFSGVIALKKNRASFERLRVSP